MMAGQGAAAARHAWAMQHRPNMWGECPPLPHTHTHTHTSSLTMWVGGRSTAAQQPIGHFTRVEHFACTALVSLCLQLEPLLLRPMGMSMYEMVDGNISMSCIHIGQSV